MRAKSLWLATLLLCAAAPPPERHYYASLPFEGPEQLGRLVAAGYDIGGVNHEERVVTVVLPERRLRSARAAGMRGIREIAPVPDAQYKKPEDVEQFLKDTERNYPHLARVESIGRSIEGREIWAIELSSRFALPPVSERPAILIDAMHHAREVMTPEVALDIVDHLTRNFESDPRVQKWLTKFRVWVVPMVNPDGNQKVWSAASMWRKNTRGGHGVDVNRNYPHDWGSCNGSSSNKFDDTYRGSGPGSEPETTALTQLAERIRPRFNLSYHSFSEIVIYPYGCSPKQIPSPDKAVYQGIGRELASKLVRDSGSGSYRAGTSYELLYNVDGGSVDWMYAKLKTMSFVIEVNGDAQGFQPSYRQWRDITVQRQRAGWQYILDKMETAQLQGGP